MKFYPEGNCDALCRQFDTIEELKQAMINNDVIEGKVVLCDKDHNLHIDLGGFRGMIPRTEGAIGIEDGTVRDIALISKVNKRVCFSVIGFEKDAYDNYIVILSRRAVQQRCIDEFLSALSVGDIIDAKVTHLEQFGAFIDIGAGVNALIPIDMLSVSRITHPSERLKVGQSIKVVLRKKEPEKLTFSLKELLGTWNENAYNFSAGDTVPGVVRSIEKYGVFIELAPNLAGLAEPHEELKVGQSVAVYIKSLNAEKMKIKLVVVEAFDEEPELMPLNYFVSDEHIDYWQYSPDCSTKKIITDFEE